MPRMVLLAASGEENERIDVVSPTPEKIVVSAPAIDSMFTRLPVTSVVPV